MKSLFYSPHQKIWKPFKKFVNNRNAKLFFTIENEKQNRMSSPDYSGRLFVKIKSLPLLSAKN